MNPTRRPTRAISIDAGNNVSQFWTGLFLLGLLLTAGFGYLLWILGPQLMHPGRSFDGTRFSGTPLQALDVFAILGGAFVFGATTMAYGAWQMGTGRRNMRVVHGMFGVIAAAVVIAAALRFASTA